MLDLIIRGGDVVIPQGVARCDLGIKGESIVNVAECPDRPAVIHGVQHVFHPPAWLGGWPSEDRAGLCRREG